MDMAGNSRCCLGIFLDKQCDRTTHCRNIGRYLVSYFTPHDIDLLTKRNILKYDDYILSWKKIFHSLSIYKDNVLIHSGFINVLFDRLTM